MILPNRTIVLALCFLGFLASAAAQPADDSGTSQAPGENIETNVVAVPPPAVAPVYGAQPVPYQFETQNNVPVVAGPTYAGLGQIGSPLMGTSSFNGGGGSGYASGAGIYQAGNLSVHLGLGYSFVYATGLEAQLGEHTTVISQSLSPTLTINLGNHWTLNYSVSLPSYSSGSGFSDSIGQSLSLAGTMTYEGWALGLSEGYSVSDTSIVETGAQTKEEGYVTGLTVSHSLGGNFSFALGLNQAIRSADQFNDVTAWSGNGSINYGIAPRTQLGVNVSASYDEVSGSSSMTSESYQGVLMVTLGPRTSLDLSGGIEESSFAAGGIPTEITPIFSASLSYQLTSATSLSLSASRSISPTFFSNLVATATSVSVGLAHHISPKLSVSVGGSYSTDSYQAIVPGPQIYTIPETTTTSALEVTRDDRGSGIGASLSYAFRARLNASVSYSYSKNSSSESVFGYSSSQVGVSVSYQY